MVEKATLESRKAELEKEFKLLDQEQEQLIEQGKVINKRLSEIRARQLQLQGSFAEVNELLSGDESVPQKEDKKKK